MVSSTRASLLIVLLLAFGLAACQTAIPSAIAPLTETLPNTSIPPTPISATSTFLPLTATAVPVTSTPATMTTRTATNDAAIVLINGTLFDGTGADPIPNAVVVIQGDRIIGVGPRNTAMIPAGAQVIDVQGGTILPGFINAHVHRGYNTSNLETWAQAGVTTVRDLSPLSGQGGVAEYYALRDEWAKQPQYARIVGASPILTAPDGYGSIYIASVEEARAKTNAMLDAGADLIKTATEDNLQGRRWQVLRPEELKAIVETAHARSVPVSVHVSRSPQVEMALAAGADDLAHMSVDELSDDLARRLVAADVYWEPTLELWNAVGWGKQPGENLRRFFQLGGRVALGTDYAGYTTPFQLGMPMHEMEYMQAAGMTARDIIIAATRNAAHVCNRDKTLGTLEKGKVADILVVKGDPLADIHALENVQLVIHNGVIIRQ